MGIYKKQISFIILCLILNCGCSSKKDSKEISRLKEINSDLRFRARNSQNILDEWFQDFSSIQNEINSINTDEIVLIDYGIGEYNNRIMDDEERIINKIHEIKLLLDQKEKQLMDNNLLYSGLKKMINDLRYELVNKEKLISLLKLENDQIKSVNKQIKAENSQFSQDLKSKYTEVQNLREEIRYKDIRLNKRYLILLSFKESKIFDANRKKINLNYKYKDIEVLSEHSSSSYDLYDKGNKSQLMIHDESKFWDDSNHLIIRIKKRRL